MSYNFDPIPIAAIHSTVLAVFFAFSAMYFHYISVKVEDAKFETFQAISKINRSTLIGDHFYFHEAGVTGENPEVGQLCKQLTRVVWGVPSKGVFHEDDVAERGHKAVHILNVLNCRYPFPARMKFSADGKLQLSFRSPELIRVSNIDEATQWLEAVDEILFNVSFLIMDSFAREKLKTILDAHYMEFILDREEARQRSIEIWQRDMEIMKKDMQQMIDETPEEDRDRVRKQTEEQMKLFEEDQKKLMEHTKPPDRGSAEVSSQNLINDLVLGLSDLQELSDSVHLQLNRIGYYTRAIPSKKNQRSLLLSACIIFVIGIIAPIGLQQYQRTPQWIIMVTCLLPFLYYVTVFIYVALFLRR